MQFVIQGGTRGELVTAATGNLDVLVLGMDVGFHFSTATCRNFSRGNPPKGAEGYRLAY
jgi:hypothetical protein